MYSVKVDSCKLSFLLSECTNVSSELTDFFKIQQINTTTGELKETDKEVRLPFILNTDFGTYYKIWIESQISNKGAELFLSVLVNSKHLGESYFQGITSDTLEQLYNHIISLNLFYCSFDTFKKARHQDTDLAFDFNCSLEHFEVLKENIKQSTLYPELWSITSQASNSGIWTPKTNSKVKPRDFATPTKPYIKFYSKQIDFETKSNVFAKHFNLISQSKNIVRFEATIQNAKHKKLLKIDNLKTFEQLLNSDLKVICSDMFKRYFEKRKFVKSKNDTPMDKVLIDLIEVAIEKGADKETIFKIFDRVDVSKKSNYNLVKKYHQLYSEKKINTDRLEANEVSKNVFQFLGVDTQTKLKL
jgi:hypothetical protein